MIRKYVGDIYICVFGVREYGFLADSVISRRYPVDLDLTLQHEGKYYEPKDSQGVPLKKYESVGVRYNPTRIAAYGLAHWNRYCITRSALNLQGFEKSRDWFFNYDGDIWFYDFDWEDNHAPWMSCMAQGEGASILVRAYEESGDVKYLDKAVRALSVFSKSVFDGGVRSKIVEEYDFLEEYPAGPCRHVLNGFLYAMIGIYDVMRHRPDIFDELRVIDLLDTLTHQLHRWDLDYWSAYDLSIQKQGRNFCTFSYHNLHCSQLYFLGDVFDRPELKSTADKWFNSSSSLSRRLSALWGKIKYRSLVRAQR